MATIMPAFDRYPQEAALIGKLVTGYGELEFILAWTVGWIINDRDAAFRRLYGSRGESQRISTAESLALSTLRGHKYETLWQDTIDNLKHCLKIRNQYAHANWVDHLQELHFASLEGLVDQQAPIDPMKLKQHGVGVPLLQRQETYFVYVSNELTFLCYEFQVEGGNRSTHPWPKPSKVSRPNL